MITHEFAVAFPDGQYLSVRKAQVNTGAGGTAFRLKWAFVRELEKAATFKEQVFRQRELAADMAGYQFQWIPVQVRREIVLITEGNL